jgi:hypothetical protein
MTITAGFDTVSELTEEMVGDLVRGNLAIGGQPRRPPFELQLPLPMNGGGTVHVIFTGVDVRIMSADRIRIRLPFERGSVVGTVTLCPLAGTVDVVASVAMRPVSGGSAPALLLGAATVTVDYDATSDVTIDAELGSLAPTFRTVAEQQVRNLVQGLGNQVMGQGFAVASAGNGSLTPLVFTRLEVHTHDDPDPARRTLAVYGNLLASTVGNGDVTTRTGRTIQPGRDIGFALAPLAFRRLVFCPQVATQLGLSVGQLPTACGSGAPTVQGLQLTRLVEFFEEGSIGLHIQAGKSGICYDVDADITGRISLTIENGNLVPTIHMDQPDIDVDIPWYCVLLAGVVLGPIGIALAATADIAGGGIVAAFAGDLITDALGGGLGSIQAPSIGGVTPTDVRVHPDGLTLSGTAFVQPAPVAPAAGILLSDGVVDVASEVLGTGMTPLVFCVENEYEYSEIAQFQQGLVTVTPTLVGRPLSPVWSVNSQLLTPSSGTLTVPVETRYALPMPGGSTAVVDAQVEYEVTSGGLVLRNRPQDGNFWLDVSVVCTECSGQTWQSSTSVSFTGNRVDAPGFYAEQQECVQALHAKLGSYRAWNRFVPRWVIVNYPSPKELVEIFAYAVSLPALEADLMLAGLASLHHASLSRSIGSPKVTGIGKVNVPQHIRG